MPQASDDRHEALPQSELTAEQLLTKLAKMIIDTNDASELTQDLIESTFNIQLEQYEEDVSDYAARLTSDWSFAISLSTFESLGPTVSLRFVPADDRPSLTMTNICAVDANAFGAELERAGFTREVSYGLHGRRYGHEYVRGSLRITASEHSEASEPDEKLSHACIAAVQIQRHE